MGTQALGTALQVQLGSSVCLQQEPGATGSPGGKGHE